ATATNLNGGGGTTFSTLGVIEQNTDVDMFKFQTGAGLVNFNIVNASRAYLTNGSTYDTQYLSALGPNLDIGASLYRADGSLVQTFNPPDDTNASFSINLDAGTYYLGIEGVGTGTPLSSTPSGYTKYGSLGQYMLSGTVQQPAPQPLTINLSLQPASTTIGNSIAAIATVNGGSNPTGSVTFSLYNNTTASGTPLFTDTELLSGGVATSANYVPTASGTLYWVATYNGDSNNGSLSSSAAGTPVTIGLASPTISISLPSASATIGSPIAASATLSGGASPSGTVTFKLYDNSAASGTPLFSDTEQLSGGKATSASYVPTTSGTLYWVATYNGDSSNSSISSSTAGTPVTIGLASPTTVFNASSGVFKNNVSYNSAPTVSGTLADIQASDGRLMTITEGTILRKGQTSSDLNSYQWTFSNLSNARSLIFEGFRSANTVNDNFSIQFSTNNGKNWTTAFTVSNSTQSRFTYVLSTPVSGTVLVRAMDTNSTSNSKIGNQLCIDWLAFSTSSSAAAPTVNAPQDDPIIGGASALGTGGAPSATGTLAPHDESGMHTLPLDPGTAVLAGSLTGSTSEAPTALASDPLAIWHPAPTPMV
ncbi:MAG: hypothetical protein ER33_09915, partial [Cyanobium sp. CACIAM 14]